MIIISDTKGIFTDHEILQCVLNQARAKYANQFIEDNVNNHFLSVLCPDQGHSGSGAYPGNTSRTRKCSLF